MTSESIIKFISENYDAMIHYPPVPASKIIPEWYKNIPKWKNREIPEWWRDATQ